MGSKSNKASAVIETQGQSNLVVQPPSISGPITLPAETDPATYQVSKSKKLIQGQSLLSARQQKVLAACIALINPKASYPDGITIELSDEQLESLTGIPKRSLHSFIDEAARAYHSIPVETPGKKAGSVDYINIAHQSRYDPDERKFKLTFHSLMEDELLNLTDYAKYALRYLTSLSSKYAIRLFEMISDYYNPKRPSPQYARVRLSDLHYSLGVTNVKGEPIVGSYAKSVSLFRQKILDPAIVEINERTIYTVACKPYRQGRSIAGFNLVITLTPLKIPGSESLAAKSTSSAYPPDSAGHMLKEEGILPAIIDRWLAEHDECVVRDNFLYLAEKRLNGMDIRSIPAFMNNLLKYNIAHLPEIANPYSSIYASSSSMKNVDIARVFIKNLVMPIWWHLDTVLRDELVMLERFDKHPVTAANYQFFIQNALEHSLDDALLFYRPDEILDQWNSSFREALA